jgi:hypothetical protein
MAAKKTKADKTKETPKPEVAESPKAEPAKKKPEAAETPKAEAAKVLGESPADDLHDRLEYLFKRGPRE